MLLCQCWFDDPAFLLHCNFRKTTPSHSVNSNSSSVWLSITLPAGNSTYLLSSPVIDSQSNMASLNPGSLTGLPESHRNSPLAPSQEMAYRQKCIDLKRRLSEIEVNNESIRQRLARERRFHDKMRLNRAILLNHMKELVESPSKAYGEDKMRLTSANVRNRISALRGGKGDGFGFEDSSEVSSGDEIKEVCRPLSECHLVTVMSCLSHSSQPEPRPVRTKRGRDGTPRASGAQVNRVDAQSTPFSTNSASMPAFHSSGMPHIASANEFSPAASAQPLEPQNSSFRIASSTSNPASTPLQPHPGPHQVFHQSPTPLHPTMGPGLPQAGTIDRSLPPLPPLPVRPTPPFDQFTAHLIPQLQADNIPSADIGPKIRETWNEIGETGQEPWKKKYGEEMMAHEKAMDEYKRAQREGSRGTKFVNGAGGGFSAVNR